MLAFDWSMGMPNQGLLKTFVDPQFGRLRAALRYTGYYSAYDLSRAGQPQVGKCLSLQEARILSCLLPDGVVSNYEWDGQTPFLGKDAGVFDATTAAKIHAACGGPANAPIYFSADAPSSGPDIGAYFVGVRQVLGPGRVGAYADEPAIAWLFDNSLIDYGWVTYAWSGGSAPDSRAHLYQFSNSVILPDGTAVDYNQILKPYYGQWKVSPAMALPSNWHDVVVNGDPQIHVDGSPFIIRGAIRTYFLGLAANCLLQDGDVPLSNEYSYSPLEFGVGDWGGGGRRQDTMQVSVGWSPSRGAHRISLGSEHATLRGMWEQDGVQIAADQQTISDLKAQVAAGCAGCPQGVPAALQAAVNDLDAKLATASQEIAALKAELDPFVK